MCMPKECPVIVYFVEKDKEIQFANYVEAAQYLGVGKWAVRDAVVKVNHPKVLRQMNVVVSPLEIDIIRKHQIKTPKHKGRGGSKVHALDLYTNEIIDTYQTIREAAMDINSRAKVTSIVGNITRCCRGKGNQAYGYKWEYAE